jgi:hypothetical protein
MPADASGCNGDALCLRVHALEPDLPLRSALDLTQRNACPLDGRSCFPLVHLVGAFHSFLEETLGSGQGAHGAQCDGLLSGHAGVSMQHRCFNNIDASAIVQKGGKAFLAGWAAPRGAAGPLLVSECMAALEWYPNLAGRYAAAWERTYWPCKQRAIRENGSRAFFHGPDALMWSRCRPAALAAHEAAHGTGGPGHEATPPVVLRSLYPVSSAVKVLAVLRNPTDRFETSYWLHPHYPRHYGANAAGLHAYAVQMVEQFSACEARHGARRCAFFYENLERDFKAFFGCDQLIRGVYWPFVAEWHAAFGEGLLVMRAEELLDSPTTARARVLAFVGLPPPPAGSTVASPPSYTAMHSASLLSYDATPMRNETRAALDAFYAPHTRRLARLLGWGQTVWRDSARPSPESVRQGAAVRYQRYASGSKPTAYGPAPGRADARPNGRGGGVSGGGPVRRRRRERPRS